MKVHQAIFRLGGLVPDMSNFGHLINNKSTTVESDQKRQLRPRRFNLEGVFLETDMPEK